jgi:hypothetical protein
MKEIPYDASALRGVLFALLTPKTFPLMHSLIIGDDDDDDVLESHSLSKMMRVSIATLVIRVASILCFVLASEAFKNGRTGSARAILKLVHEMTAATLMSAASKPCSVRDPCFARVRMMLSLELSKESLEPFVVDMDVNFMTKSLLSCLIF